MTGEPEPEFPIDGTGKFWSETTQACGKFASKEDVGGFAVNVLEVEGMAGKTGSVEDTVGSERAAEEKGAAVRGDNLGGGEYESDVGC